MGGERFETGQPEAFLFGDNSDLNFLGGKPVQFPYSNAQLGNEPTRTLQSLVHVRRDSVKFVRQKQQPEARVVALLPSLPAKPLQPVSTLSVISETGAAQVVTIPAPADVGAKNHTLSPIKRGKFRSALAGAASRFGSGGGGADPSLRHNKNRPASAHCVDVPRQPSSPDSGTVQTSAQPLDLPSNDASRPTQELCLTADAPNVEQSASTGEHGLINNCRYNIEFTFDCDCPVSVQIVYFATEECGSKGLVYHSRRPDLSSKIYKYPTGVNQVFSQTDHVFEPALFKKEEVSYSSDAEVIPVVIHLVADATADHIQEHCTFGTIEPSAEGHGFLLKPLKQKLYADGVAYLLQEIYGIENKNATDNCKIGEEYLDDGGTECVICMFEFRDTLILPCRHLCLCNTCADTLRYKASNCPICRSPFRALLQLKTTKKCRNSTFANSSGIVCQDPNTAETSFLSRIEAQNVPLIEALNGPSASTVHRQNQLTAAHNFPTHKSPVVAATRNKNRRKSGRTVSPIQEVLVCSSVRLPDVEPRSDPPEAEAMALAGESLACDVSLPGSVIDAAENALHSLARTTATSAVSARRSLGSSTGRRAISSEAVDSIKSHRRYASHETDASSSRVHGLSASVTDRSHNSNAALVTHACHFGVADGITHISIDEQYGSQPSLAKIISIRDASGESVTRGFESATIAPPQLVAKKESNDSGIVSLSSTSSARVNKSESLGETSPTECRELSNAQRSCSLGHLANAEKQRTKDALVNENEPHV